MIIREYFTVKKNNKNGTNKIKKITKMLYFRKKKKKCK